MNEARDLSKKVKDYALDKVGFDLVGIASAFDPQFERAPKGHHPEEWLPGAKSVIVGGIKVIREILETTPSTLYAKHYDQMNTWLSEAGYRLVRGLQDMGFKALYFPETDPYTYLHRETMASHVGPQAFVTFILPLPPVWAREAKWALF
jgi:hypothetical protein